jgi:hypothetical protein
VSEETVYAVRDAFQRVRENQLVVNFAYPEHSGENFAQTAAFMRIQSAARSSLGARRSSPTLRRCCNELMKTRITLTRVCFSDEGTFHTSEEVNRHNVRMWGVENPRVVLENERDRPKVSVWCALMHIKVTGPFFLLSTPFQQSFTWT